MDKTIVSATLPTLDVAVCTMADGINRFAATEPPVVEGVRWVVSWQRSAGIAVPASLAGREDIVILPCDSTGLSNNRNNALAHTDADIVLIADDDITYTSESLKAVRTAFAQYLEADIITFKVEYPDKDCYPATTCRLHDPLPKGYFLTSPEMAIRRRAVKSIHFSPMLGIGSADMHSGEEELVLNTAIRRGLNCRFVPIAIGKHPAGTTFSGTALPDPVVRGNGCLTRIVYPWTWPLRIILKAWRLHKAGQMAFGHACRVLLQGAGRAKAVIRGER